MKLRIIAALVAVSLSTGIFAGCADKKEYLPEATNDKQITVVAGGVKDEPKEEESAPPTPEERAVEMLADMTLEEKVGQMFFARCPAENAVNDVKNYALGGYIFFGRDFENKTPEDVKNNIESYQSAAKIPMLIGIDEEGGKVVRASKYSAFRSAPFPSPKQLYENGGLDAVKTDTAEKAEFLKTLGINVNLAPVCDVSQNPKDYIYPRTLGEDAQTTALYTAVVAKQMEDSKIGSVLKHFPGYGNNADTHKGVAYDERDMETFEAEDFLPFIAAINVGADAVLVSHNIVTCMDDQRPASLSPAVHEILRTKLNFKGVIMTDDTAMEGIKAFTDVDTAVQAVLAGNDMIITSDHQTQYNAVMNAIKTGEIGSERIDEAVTRILVWKMELGLIT
ncbi:MAG: glycoside hydrolase family 3 N-terminal domain-containing protein [Lachnospiraceae bacterium]|nr:glycoside hydrolase family 3 N-terminal domain-containing protein [Lachnospiraceae bacterium]